MTLSLFVRCAQQLERPITTLIREALAARGTVPPLPLCTFEVPYTHRLVVLRCALVVLRCALDVVQPGDRLLAGLDDTPTKRYGPKSEPVDAHPRRTVGLEPAARAVVRPQRLPLGRPRTPAFSRQPPQGVTPVRLANRIINAYRSGPAPSKNPPTRRTPDRFGRVT